MCILGLVLTHYSTFFVADTASDQARSRRGGDKVANRPLVRKSCTIHFQVNQAFDVKVKEKVQC